MLNPINLYAEAQRRGLQPALLLSPEGRCAKNSLTILGIKPIQKLEVREGKLYINGIHCGPAQELFRHLQFSSSGSHFFPAFIGFCAYEFARYFGLKAHVALEELPEATFYLYDQGFVWRDDELIERPGDVDFSAPIFSYSLRALNITPSTSDAQFLTGVGTIQEAIRAGEVYQVNLSRRYEFDSTALSPIGLLASMKKANPSPFMGIVEGKDWAVISGSPERLFKFSQSTVQTRPIAGTRRRGRNDSEDQALEAELIANQKERAEHAMLVDLCRNDLARIADAPVVLPELFTVERYSHVMHLVSEVSAFSTKELVDIFPSIFPGGTITGAPKASVMNLIAQCERVPRGSYTGCLGYVSQGQGSDFNILIRSCFFAANKGYFSAGAGIVIDSDAQKELEETAHKAESLRALLSSAPHPTVSPLCRGREVLMPASIIPTVSYLKPTRRVLFVENNDSFSFNIIDALKSAGCEVDIRVSSDAISVSSDISHIIIGPGPGTPHSTPHILAWVALALEKHLPLLGVCLGHQALGVWCGTQLERTSPIHGQAHEVFHAKHKLFGGIPSPSPFTRYHSLMLKKVVAPLKIIAWLESGEIMAVAHENKIAFGVQFHPESFLSLGGPQLLRNFLEITP